MRPHSLIWSWLLAAACGDGRAMDRPPMEVTAQDPEVQLAVQAAQALVLANPKEARLQIELAAVLDANELDLPAQEAWTRAAELDPKNAHVWYHLSRVEERRGAPAEALAALERVQELAPDYGPAHVRAGRLLMDFGRLDEAERALRRALELEPDSPAPSMAMARLELLREEPARVLARLEPLRERYPREPYLNGLLARACSMVGDSRAQRFLQAEKHSGASAARDPWRTEVQARACGLRVRIDRARGRLASGDAAGAWEEMEPLESRSDEFGVLTVQCQVLLALGRNEEVLERIARAEPSLRTSTQLVVNRVLALRGAGDVPRALAEISAEVQRNPVQPLAHALLGEILFELERFPEAAVAFEASRERGDESLSCVLLLARSRAAAGDFPGALRDLDGAAEGFPFAPKPWAYRSEYLALEGRFDEARASLEEARQRGLEPELAGRVAARLNELSGEEQP